MSEIHHAIKHRGGKPIFKWDILMITFFFICSFGPNLNILDVSLTMLLIFCTGVGGEEATEH